MSSVNTFNPKIDRSVQIFDEFYDYSQEVDANTFDVVNSYFESVMATDKVARNFTTTLFRIAQQTSIPVLDILAELQGLDAIQLTAVLAYYLNGLRSPSTLLGVNQIATPNYWTARNVLP